MNEEGDKMETPKNLNTYLIHQRRYFHMHPELDLIPTKLLLIFTMN